MCFTTSCFCFFGTVNFQVHSPYGRDLLVLFWVKLLGPWELGLSLRIETATFSVVTMKLLTLWLLDQRFACPKTWFWLLGIFHLVEETSNFSAILLRGCLLPSVSAGASKAWNTVLLGWDMSFWASPTGKWRLLVACQIQHSDSAVNPVLFSSSTSSSSSGYALRSGPFGGLPGIRAASRSIGRKREVTQWCSTHKRDSSFASSQLVANKSSYRKVNTVVQMRGDPCWIDGFAISIAVCIDAGSGWFWGLPWCFWL